MEDAGVKNWDDAGVVGGKDAGVKNWDDAEVADGDDAGDDSRDDSGVANGANALSIAFEWFNDIRERSRELMKHTDKASLVHIIFTRSISSCFRNN
ncbi:hypothetical protein [Pasteuria penetrans]|uniref:hypothetical protein n=1 Tax=Pasteuria penetrans TaxID=86005 RepID=UPI0011F015AF|nr:hypothetical protein [Pasteuria penetrans]